jgi:hypothetical protein
MTISHPSASYIEQENDPLFAASIPLIPLPIDFFKSTEIHRK